MIAPMDDPPHIVVADDDGDICDLISDFLGKHGFSVATALTARDLDKQLAARKPDLVLLDLMLPDADGLSLCRSLKQRERVPVIIVSALGDEPDRVTGLEMGADDYLAKPFSPREMLARIKAVLRRSSGTTAAARERSPSAAVYRFEGWRLDSGRRELRNPLGALVDLSSAELDLLIAFARHPQRVMARNVLLGLARGRTAGPLDRTIDVHIGRLRRKLEDDPRHPSLIKTVRGGGYVFSPAVTVEPGG